ncbi:hypothetical protein [Planctomicrobium piriforme]|uniref:Uncharacterized protein n=1 Tax=Planctomicrobium piriforme TaxID=1576369 RepID=A0A1I3AR49_9PLAN|nr:hypothetical protein [Planctomicrobium piriforme]SFH52484.1 hypothetical protein SAMN05421753_10113 [Planctomicrobium piriforme]
MNEIEEAVAIAMKNDVNQHRIQIFDNIAATFDTAQNFVQALILKQTTDCDDAYTALSNIQDFFENLAEHSATSACIFMAHLWPVAGDQVDAHDVYNTIDLWLTDHTDATITRHLEYIATNTADEDVRRHVNDLLAVRAGVE